MSNLIQKMLLEVQAYQSLEKMEALIETESDLSPLPLQPLYLSFHALPPQKTASYLPKLSCEQRQSLIDLDFWHKDELDLASFEYWLDSYSAVTDEKVRQEFLMGEDFYHYLKARFNVWTFDTEDPQYPDHDHYFLTDDSQLLFEFDETYNRSDQVRELIREIYGLLGVDEGYSYFFKMVSSSYLELTEERFQQKKRRLEDFGVVDYYDSLKLQSPFSNLESMVAQLRKKAREAMTPEIDDVGKNQTLALRAVSAFKGKTALIEKELELISEVKREDFLRFDLIRTVNANLAFTDALKEGSIQIKSVGEKTIAAVNLGLQFLRNEFSNEVGEGSILDAFDFGDCYRVGQSMIHFELGSTKKLLTKTFSDGADGFLGKRFESVLDASFQNWPSLIAEEGKWREVVSYDDYLVWKSEIELIRSLIPLAGTFYQLVSELRADDRIEDYYYLNYNLSDIDFEVILMTQFAHHVLEIDAGQKKLGITLVEFKKFAKSLQFERGMLVSPFLESFMAKYQLVGISGLHEYLGKIIFDQLEGYDWDEISDEEFKHVGGPIIFIGT